VSGGFGRGGSAGVLFHVKQGGSLAASSHHLLAFPPTSTTAPHSLIPPGIYAICLALSVLAILLPHCGRPRSLVSRRSRSRSWCRFCAALMLIAYTPVATQAAESVIHVHHFIRSASAHLSPAVFAVHPDVEFTSHRSANLAAQRSCCNRALELLSHDCAALQDHNCARKSGAVNALGNNFFGQVALHHEPLV